MAGVSGLCLFSLLFILAFLPLITGFMVPCKQIRVRSSRSLTLMQMVNSFELVDYYRRVSVPKL